jgi:hypothetical protein
VREGRGIREVGVRGGVEGGEEEVGEGDGAWLEGLMIERILLRMLDIVIVCPV